MQEKQKDEMRPFSARDKVGYMFGDFANDFTFVFANLFLMKFYTDIMDVSAVIVGAMMMVVKFVDAFTDVTMGQIVDRSPQTNKGKFAPWLRRMAGPVALASFLMYAVWFRNMPMGFKIFWMFFTYLLWGSICYTGANIPYGSMASAITSEPKERAELSKFRTIGASLASIVIGVVFPLTVYYTNENGNKVLSASKLCIASGICSIAAFVCYMLCYRLTTERIRITKKTEKFNLKDLVSGWIKSPGLIAVVCYTIFLGIATNTLSGMATYIYPNYFGNTKAQSLSTLIGILITLFCAVFVIKLSTRLGRKKLAVIASIFSSIVMFSAFFIHTHNAWIFVALYGIAYAGYGMISLINWAIIGDVIDAAELKTGKREDGNIYSLYSFSRKMSQSFASGIIGLMLTAIGYKAETAFDASVVNGIYNITCLIPAIAFLIVALIMHFIYPLDKKIVEENAEKLKKIHENMEEK